MKKFLFFTYIIVANWFPIVFSMQQYSETYKKEYILTYEKAARLPGYISLNFYENEQRKELELAPEIFQAHIDAISDVLNNQPNKFKINYRQSVVADR